MSALLMLLDHQPLQPFLGRRKLRGHLLQRLSQDAAHDQVAIPFVVGRHDIPRPCRLLQRVIATSYARW